MEEKARMSVGENEREGLDCCYVDECMMFVGSMVEADAGRIELKD